MSEKKSGTQLLLASTEEEETPSTSIPAGKDIDRLFEKTIGRSGL